MQPKSIGHRPFLPVAPAKGEKRINQVRVLTVSLRCRSLIFIRQIN